MPPAFKKIISTALTLGILFVAYFGSYLPFRKSKLFIQTLQKSDFNSVEDIKQTFKIPFDAPSPIGQEEIVRNSGNVIFRLMQQTENKDQIVEMASFLEEYFKPIIDRGKGMSFSQNLFILGRTNQSALFKTKDLKYLEGARRYYAKGLEVGPKRPQFLYGMLELALLINDVRAAKVFGEEVLKYWPTDEGVRNALSTFLLEVQPLTPTPNKK